MKRKIIKLFTINIVLLLLLTYINGYRLTRYSIYKGYMSHYEAESYEELLREKEFSVVKYDNNIVTFFFEPNYLLQRLDNWKYVNQPIVATNENTYLNYTLEFRKDSSINFDHYLMSSGMLVYSKIGPIDIKLGSLSDQSKLVDIEYSIESIYDNIYYYKFKVPVELEDMDNRFVFFQNDERIYDSLFSDRSIDKLVYNGIDYGSRKFIDVLQGVPSGYVNYSVPIDDIEPILKFNYYYDTDDAWYKSLYEDDDDDEVDYGMMDVLLFKYKDDYYYDTNISKNTEELNPSLLDKEALLHNLKILENNIKQEIGE